MNRADIVSLVMLILGPLLAAAFIFLMKPRREKIKAAFIAGLFVALANFLIEVVAAPNDVYYVWGLWPIFNSPLSRTIAWVFLGMVFAFSSDFPKALPRPRLGLALHLIIAIIIGLFFDWLGTRSLEFMALGENGNWIIIFFIWGSLVPGMTLIYKLLSRKKKE